MEPIIHLSPEFPSSPNPSQHRRRRRILTILAITIFLIGSFYLGSVEHRLTIYNFFVFGASPSPSATPDPDYAMPQKEDDRLDILILGIRGENDPNASDGGPLLTDSIQIFSYDKTTKKSSLVSMPRDLLVKIHADKKDKLNSAYEYGLNHSPESFKYIKDKFSEITGIYIDHVVVFDFSSFKEIIDALGGVDITLDAPFKESQQWGYAFSLPAGPNHLDGQSALYYARSRYSSSDFDRSRRQQQIMFAVKDKLLQLHFLSDPLKSFSVLSLVRNDLKTDISIWNIKQLLDLVNQMKFDQMKRTVISTDNLLIEGRENGIYVLLPKGSSLTGIKKFFKESLK